MWSVQYQEGLPAYWGIETGSLRWLSGMGQDLHQEGLPAYWGIETFSRMVILPNFVSISGRTTRLLGY